MNKKENHNEGNEARIYEFSYLLVPTLSHEAAVSKIEALKSKIASYGGEVIGEENPHIRGLAYEMRAAINNAYQTYNDAYFGWVKFELPYEKTGALTKDIELDKEIFRFLLIKTVRENTIWSKRSQMKQEAIPEVSTVVEEGGVVVAGSDEIVSEEGASSEAVPSVEEGSIA